MARPARRLRSSYDARRQDPPLNEPQRNRVTQPEAADRRAMRIGVASMLAVTAVWMVIPIMVKIALRSFDPIVISAVRLPVATALLASLHRARGGRLRDLVPGSGWHLLGGIALGVNYQLYALGMSLTTAGAGTVIIQVQIVTLVLLARWVLRERLSAVKLAAIIGVIAGGGLVLAAPGAVDELTASSHRAGNLAMLGSGIGFGAYGLASRALAGRQGPGRGAALQIAVPLLGIASVVNLLLLPFARWPESVAVDAIVALVSLGVIGTAANYALMAVAFRHLSAATAGTITALTPPGVIVLAAVTLGEPVPLSIVAATGIVTAGLFALMMDERGSGARARNRVTS